MSRCATPDSLRPTNTVPPNGARKIVQDGRGVLVLTRAFLATEVEPVGGAPAAVPPTLGGVLADCVDGANLSAYRAADPRQIVTALLGGMQRYTLPDEVREDYLGCYEGDRLMQSMAYMRTYPSQLPALLDLLQEISAPVQIIAGRRDAMVPPVNAQVLHQQLPNSSLALLDAGHFVWEDAADEYAALVSSWWATHRADTSS